MIDKDQKYYGEVWFPSDENLKQFAILTFKDDDLLIETNLISRRSKYSEDQIVGAFIGVGYITFVDCSILHYFSGIVSARIYKPRYSFISAEHVIDVENIAITQFEISTNAIVKWISAYLYFDGDKLSSKQIQDSYEIAGNFNVTIKHFQEFTSNNAEVRAKNFGSILFTTEEPVSMLKAIEIYNDFQKILQLLTGGSAKFEHFIFKCEGCGEWQQIYYNDKKFSRSSYNYVSTSYEQIKENLTKVLSSLYTDQNFYFCLDKLIENFISTSVSYNKRFTNSISAFEAFGKLYSGKTKQSLQKLITQYAETFILLGKFTAKDWDDFPNKVVRSRDYHIHSNLGNKDVYSEFELLYVSYLFDYLIGYLLLSNLNVSNLILDKFIVRCNSRFVEIKNINELLSESSLRKKL